MDQNYNNNHNLLVFIYKYRKHLLFIILLSAVISGIIAFIIPVKFKSTAVIYPSNTSSMRSLLDNNVSSKSIVDFGDEEKTEQLLEVLNSEKIRNFIIEEYDLMHHYNIDPKKEKTPWTLLDKKYQKNFTFSKNKNMALEIEVLDQSPDTAALMAKSVLEVLDETMNAIAKKRAIQGFHVVENAYLKLENEIKSMEDSLNKIMSLGVINIESQSEVYTKAYADALLKNNTKVAQQIEKKLEVISDNGAKLTKIIAKLNFDLEKLSVLKGKYEQARADAQEHMDSFFTISSPYPAEKKSYPIRWLIVSISVFGALVLGIVVLVVFEEIQKIRANMPKL